MKPGDKHSRKHSGLPDFLTGGGEMGELIRAFDWASTAVGPPETWPQSLRLTVRLMLNSQHPMFIWWGKELIQFYNDGYRQTMGPEMHPSALGARGRECWADIWPIIGPQIEYVMAGKGATWNVDQLVPINRTGTPEEVWWTYGFSPIDMDDTVGGVLVVCNDVTEQHVTTEVLKDRTQRLAQLFEQAPSFIAAMRGPDHVFEMANAVYRRMVGNRPIIGKPVGEALPEIRDQGLIDMLDRVYQTGEAHIGRRTPVMLQRDSSHPPRLHYLDFVYEPIVDADGTISGVFLDGQDVTDHTTLEKRLALINDELRHRAKNMLAMIGAVASQTLRAAADPEALRRFQARLAAFGAAQDALAGSGGSTSAVRDVIAIALNAHAPDATRFDISGPEIFIGSRQALSLALAVHELATNATKYGALSNDSGIVTVRWWIDCSEQETFRLEWTEGGGPTVSEPSQKGFGSRMVENVLAADFGAQVTMRYDPEGVSLSVSAPRDKLNTAAEQSGYHTASRIG